MIPLGDAKLVQIGIEMKLFVLWFYSTTSLVIALVRWLAYL